MRKIHITEAQLSELKKKLEEAYTIDGTKETEAAGGNVKTAWDNIKSKNPQLSQQADNGEVNIAVNPTGIDEGIDEYNRVSDDSYEYQQVYDYLESLNGTAELYSLLSRMWGNQGEVNTAIDEIYDYFGGEIDKNAIMSALYDFRNEYEEMQNNLYRPAMEEARRYTKRQIKEAKLKALRENSVMFKKSDLR